MRIRTSACAAACRRGLARTPGRSPVTTDLELEAEPTVEDYSVRAFFTLGFLGCEVEGFELVDFNGIGFPREAGFDFGRSGSGGATGVLISSNAA